MFKGFKEFISQGNALELAVAVIIGAAFSPIVKAITDVIMAMISQVVGQPNFDSVGNGVDDRLERGTDDNGDGELEGVALGNELLESLNHGDHF